MSSGVSKKFRTFGNHGEDLYTVQTNARFLRHCKDQKPHQHKPAIVFDELLGDEKVIKWIDVLVRQANQSAA